MTIDIRELQNRLNEVLAITAAGGEVVVYDGTTPRARLLPIAPPKQRVAGLHPGALVPSADFDAPLPEEFWSDHHEIAS